jgi:hypothetical protein
MEALKLAESSALMGQRQNERVAYEKTRMHLVNLKKKIANLRKRNQREADLDKKVDFLVSSDF